MGIAAASALPLRTLDLFASCHCTARLIVVITGHQGVMVDRSSRQIEYDYQS